MIEWDLTLGGLSRIGSRWVFVGPVRVIPVPSGWGKWGISIQSKSVVGADGFLGSVSRNTVQPDRRLVIGVGVWISTTLHSEKSRYSKKDGQGSIT